MLTALNPRGKRIVDSLTEQRVLERCAMYVNRRYNSSPHWASIYLHRVGLLTFGIEHVACADRELTYLNVGESYGLTIIREGFGPLEVGSWGGWLEAAEQDHCEENDAVRCGYCSDFTPVESPDWSTTRCESCGHNVSTGEPMQEPMEDATDYEYEQICPRCHHSEECDGYGGDDCPECWNNVGIAVPMNTVAKSS